MFDNVRAYEKNGGVLVEWSNLTERDLRGYVIERSTDGLSFDSVSFQVPLNNRNDRMDYSAYDDSPSLGNNFYRIRVEGTIGRNIISTVLKVTMEKGQHGFGIYPNPVTSDQVSLNISVKRPGNLSIHIYDMLGVPVLQKMIFCRGRSGTQTLQLPSLLKAGMYILLLSDGEWQGKKMFIKK